MALKSHQLAAKRHKKKLKRKNKTYTPKRYFVVDNGRVNETGVLPKPDKPKGLVADTDTLEL